MKIPAVTFDQGRLRCPFVLLQKGNRTVEIRGVTTFADQCFYDRVYSVRKDQQIHHQYFVDETQAVKHSLMGFMSQGLCSQSMYFYGQKYDVRDDVTPVVEVKQKSKKRFKRSCVISPLSLVCTRKAFAAGRFLASQQRQYFGTKKVVRVTRQEMAALYADLDTNRHLVLIWGEGYVEGIVANLKLLGWELKNLRRVTAVFT